MRRQSSLIAFSLLLVGLLPAATPSPVTLVRQSDRVRIEIGGRHFTDYIHRGWPKPCLYPILDAAQTPNTQLTFLDYPALPMLVENRNLPQKAGVKAMDSFRGIREGFGLVCEGGAFVGLKGGGWIYDNAGKRVRQFPGEGGGKHMPNFLAAVRSRRAEDLNAPISEGHVSSSLCHLGNISWRLGQPAGAGACRQAWDTQAEAGRLVESLERNVAANGVDLAKTSFVLGPWLEIDGATDSIRAVTGGGSAALAAARRLARGSDRPPFAFGG
jgi:hypothetical protein